MRCRFDQMKPGIPVQCTRKDHFTCVPWKCAYHPTGLWNCLCESLCANFTMVEVLVIMPWHPSKHESGEIAGVVYHGG